MKDGSYEAKAIYRPFPGPRDANITLRVAIERSAYGDLIAHAKSSLNAEVCGVLVGQVCEDEGGTFVHVEHIIQGAAANEGSTHVTFTQQTWNSIHATLESRFPKARIVGWYHTHPGFGVEFSDMDLFIQKNFFSGQAQIALVMDPLSGAVAICVNKGTGTQYVPRFWVDSREHPAKVPESRDSLNSGSRARTGEEGDSARRLEERVGQLVQVVDELRASYHRLLFFCGLVVCLGVIGTSGYFIYNAYTSKFEPPHVQSYVPVPIQVGDKTVLVGVGIVDWKVPDELNAALLQLERAKKEAAEREMQKEADTSTNSAAPGKEGPGNGKK